MPTLEQYRRKLQGQQRVIKEQRRKAADLNNELAWELADGHQDVQVLTRTAIDDMTGEWRDGDMLIRHALTGQEKKIITKPYIQLPIGSYVKYSNVTCIVREALLDPNDVMPSYKAYVCTSELHLKGCPYTFPVYAFNSSYSSKGIVDYDKVLGLDSRNKLYLQKNKFTVRLQHHHRNYRIIIGDEETKYYYYITEMDDVSYPGMFVVSLKIDEMHPNDNGFYAYNENPIDFSDLIGVDEEVEEPQVTAQPIIYCSSYLKVGETYKIECNNPIAVCEVNDYDMVSLREEENGVYYTILPQTPGILKITVTDTYGNVVTKDVIIK